MGKSAGTAYRLKRFFGWLHPKLKEVTSENRCGLSRRAVTRQQLAQVRNLVAMYLQQGALPPKQWEQDEETKNLQAQLLRQD